MKLKSSHFVLMALFVTKISSAGLTQLSPELIQATLRLLSVKDLASVAQVDRLLRAHAAVVIPPELRSSVARLEQIEALMNKWGSEDHPGGFINLPSGNQIYKAGVTQELWAAVMQNDPSYFINR